MGTQQILMIVLSVIIVGIAVAVGIQMFQTQQKSADVQAVAADLQNYASQLIGYHQATAAQGGCGGDWNNGTASSAGIWLGWGGTTTTNENALYTVATTATTATITASANDNANGSIATITQADVVTTVINND
ncbi:MAG: hypothetical protein U9N34_03660 [Candidatus Cloacimonadota bacterium]|nr:hypothetical protein [Candidatus Cloacimonadota bacterium]